MHSLKTQHKRGIKLEQMNHTPHAPISAIMLMSGFCLFGPAIDMFAKLASDSVPLLQITAARFGFQLILLIPIAIFMKCLHLPNRKEIASHFLRGGLILMATTLFFLAVRYLPLADALAIFFIEPFFLTFLAVLFLGEPIGWRRVIACIIGFCGALLVIQPQYQQVGWPALLPVGTALCFAFFLLLTRRMTQTDSPVTIQIFTSVAATLLLVPAVIILHYSDIQMFRLAMPNAVDWLLLLGVGVSATIAHLFLTSAFARAPVGILAPLQYLEIVTATLFGIWIFGDVPNILTILGVIIIVLSGLYVLYREGKQRVS